MRAVEAGLEFFFFWRGDGFIFEDLFEEVFTFFRGEFFFDVLEKFVEDVGIVISAVAIGAVYVEATDEFVEVVVALSGENFFGELDGADGFGGERGFQASEFCF